MKFLLPVLALIALPAAAQEPPPLFEQALPDLPGKEVILAEVELPPGAASQVHRHNAHVIVYVLQGSIIMQVQGQPEQTLGVGQTYYEKPDDIHTVGCNASATEPARFLAFFVKTKGAPRSVMVK